jgi:hypothetical protein
MEAECGYIISSEGKSERIAWPVATHWISGSRHRCARAFDPAMKLARANESG